MPETRLLVRWDSALSTLALALIAACGEATGDRGPDSAAGAGGASGSAGASAGGSGASTGGSSGGSTGGNGGTSAGSAGAAGISGGASGAGGNAGGQGGETGEQCGDVVCAPNSYCATCLGPNGLSFICLPNGAAC